MDEKAFPAWSLSVDECLKAYNVKLHKGLSSYDVEKQREVFGWNELKKEKQKPLWQLVIQQFDDMLVKILIVAAFISFILAHFEEKESQNEACYVEPVVINPNLKRNRGCLARK